jgi:hypothetical protein
MPDRNAAASRNGQRSATLITVPSIRTAPAAVRRVRARPCPGSTRCAGSSCWCTVRPMESPYLTTREAAAYLRFESPSAIRNLVMLGELVPAGAGPYGTHMFLREELDRFVRDRGAPRALGENAPRPALSPVGAHVPGPVRRRGRKPVDRQTPKDGWGLRAIVDGIIDRRREEPEKSFRPSRRTRSQHEPAE